ncbi:MAG: c-type cytochrome [Methylococcales bacterium]
MIKASNKIISGAVFAATLILGTSLSQAFAAGVCTSEGTAVDETTWIGSKIYDRTFGRGCATCHDVSPNPNLLESVKKLSKDEFATVLKNGRNGMPKAIDAIKAVGPVKKANLSDDQAIEAIWVYLNCRSEGKVPAGQVDKK